MKDLIPALPSFILNLANQATEIRILDHVAEVKSSEVIGEGQNEVLYLSWQDNDQPMSTIFTEESLKAGFWVGDKLVCPDYDGEVVYLHFLNGTQFLHPVVDLKRDRAEAPCREVVFAGLEAMADGHVHMGNLADLATDLRNSASDEGCEAGLTVVDGQALNALLQAVSRMKKEQESIQPMAKIARQLMQCHSAELLSSLFPTQYQSLLSLHELNVVADIEMGYNWETLTPALARVTDALGYAQIDADDTPTSHATDVDVVDTVVDYVQNVEMMYGFKIAAVFIREVVVDSATLLQVHLDEKQLEEAIVRLLTVHPATSVDHAS